MQTREGVPRTLWSLSINRNGQSLRVHRDLPQGSAFSQTRCRPARAFLAPSGPCPLIVMDRACVSAATCLRGRRSVKRDAKNVVLREGLPRTLWSLSINRNGQRLVSGPSTGLDALHLLDSAQHVIRRA